MRDYGKFNLLAYRMVVVYILGHKVGDIEKPVLYVSHDYYGNKVTKGIPDPFVESLYENDDGTQMVLHRLRIASSDAKL